MGEVLVEFVGPLNPLKQGCKHIRQVPFFY